MLIIMIRCANILLLFAILNFGIPRVYAQQISAPRAQALQFIENANQWPEQVLYRTEVNGMRIYLEKNGFTFDVFDEDAVKHTQGGQTPQIMLRHAYQMQFIGAKNQIPVSAAKPGNAYYNFLIGNDPTKWASHVKGYAEVLYDNVYAGIDMRVYSSGDHLKYDFIVQPGANVDEIQMQYSGLYDILVKDGQLHLVTAIDTLTELQPYAWQVKQNKVVAVVCNYQVEQNVVSFYFPDGYDRNYELIIDPELVFGSYSGSTTDNWGYTATFDVDGNLFGGGAAFGGGYPTTVGAFDLSYSGGDTDVSISKWNATGTDLIYSTFIGGTNAELPHSMMATNDKELVIYGTTSSSNFPISAGAYDNSFNGGTSVTVDGIFFSGGTDIYVVKLNADGSALLGSTFVGGTGNDGLNIAAGYTTHYNYGDFIRGEVIVDAFENIYVASNTVSSSFPTTPGVFQSALAGGQEGVLFKLTPNCSALTWSSFIGGSAEEGAYSMKLTSTGQLVVGGGTASSDFPVTPGAWDETYSGGVTDGFVSIISPDGTTLEYSSFAGTNNYDQVYFVETDADDNIYITGQTKGVWTVTAGVYSEAGGKQFITKLEPDLSAIMYSTVFGSGGSAVNISPSAFLVDQCENVYVSGWGGSVNQGYNFSTGSTVGMTITPDAIQSTTDGSDFYFFVVSKNAVDLVFASYFGGPVSPEHVDGGTSRFDKAGAIYQAVCAGCWGLDDFPTTAGAWSEVNGSSLCNLGVAKIEFNIAGVYAEAVADPSFIGCVPFDVDFINTSAEAEDYIWDFGDGSPLNYSFEPAHTYTEPGTYEVMLIVIDSLTCNIADTAYLTVTVLSEDIEADFEYVLAENCDSLTATLSTLGTYNPTTVFEWDFGDGLTSDEQNPEHAYYEPGSYTITLIVSDPFSCNAADTFSLNIEYLYEFNTGFTAEALGCLPVEATFTPLTETADTYIWIFGDGAVDTTGATTHIYTEPGIYEVSLIAILCGVPDTLTQEVIIDGWPVAYFDAYPEYAIIQTPTVFTNLSTNAVTYEWNYGDGTTSTDKNGYHVYEEEGVYTVCLTATNSNGCSDVYCRTVEVVNEGAVGIPNAFSPNGDGVNDVIYIKGFGFDEIQLLIFNRWGELVFQTNDRSVGWDGTYKGQMQETEVYVYVLTGSFLDGKPIELKGNISLLQ